MKNNRLTFREWFKVSEYIYSVRRKDGRAMAASVFRIPGKNTWVAVAVFSGPNNKNIDDLLNEHSHKNFGAMARLKDARAAVEKFACKWLRSKAVADRCECGEEEGSAMLVKLPRTRV